MLLLLFLNASSMSVNASSHELIHLIFRHLKDHGFGSAADELQRHSPQVDTDVSASLLDIYSSWLNSGSRKKRKHDSAKHSTSKEPGRTPAKATTKVLTAAISNQTQIEDSRSSDGEEPSQSLLPQAVKIKAGATSPQVKTPKKKVSHTSEQEGPAVAKSPFVATPTRKRTDPQKKNPSSVKRKKNESKSPLNVIKAKKSKVPTKVKVVAAGDDDSDSDSSLDVEKWKKLVLQMTEADLAKMDTINALDLSACPPKKKPSTKTDSMVEQNKGMVEKNEEVEKKVMTETPAKNIKPKKSRQKKSEPVTSATLSQEQNSTEVDRQATSTLSSPTQTTKDNREGDTCEDNDETTPKPKKRKKKREKTEGSVKENTNETVEEQELGDGTVKMTKRVEEPKGKGNYSEEEIIEKNLSGNVDDKEIREPKVQQNKAKKKKKTHDEGNSEQGTENEKLKRKKKTVSEEKSEQKAEDDDKNVELVAENVKENTEPEVQEKKAKNKKRKKTHDEENSEQGAEEEKVKKKNRTYSGEKSEQKAEEDNKSVELVAENVKENTEPNMHKHKAKKKKRKKTHDEENSEQGVEEEKVKRKNRTYSGEKSQQKFEEDNIGVELVAENVKENTEPIVQEKQAKKRKSVDNSVKPAEEYEVKSKKKMAESGENSEQIVKEKKKRKKGNDYHDGRVSEQIVEGNTTTRSEINSDGQGKLKQNTEGNKNKMGSSLENDSVPPLSPNPERASPQTERKKKKSKLTSEEVQETLSVSVQEAEATQTPITPTRRKKKSSKSSES